MAWIVNANPQSHLALTWPESLERSNTGHVNQYQCKAKQNELKRKRHTFHFIIIMLLEFL